MGRHERPLTEGPLRDFAAELRALRVTAGNPTYRELSRRAGYSGSALAAAASGQALPTLELTLAYAVACGGEARYWRGRWHETALNQQCDQASQPATGDEPETSPTSLETDSSAGQDAGPAEVASSADDEVETWLPEPDRPLVRRRAAVPVAAIALAVGAALTAIRLGAARSNPRRSGRVRVPSLPAIEAGAPPPASPPRAVRPARQPQRAIHAEPPAIPAGRR